MTNKEAAEIMKAIIFILKNDDYSDEVEEAIHMAINALTLQTTLKEKCLVCEHCARCDSELANDSPELDNNFGDLIRRQKAIDAIEILLEHSEDDEHDKTWNNAIRGSINAVKHHVPSAQPETHDERTEMHSCDCIDRQAAIDALEKVAELYPWRVPGDRDSYSQYNEAWQDALNRADSEIETLPSVQPEIIRCGQCKYAEVADKEDAQDGYTCQFHRGSVWFSGSYCSWAERRDDG